MGRRKGLRWPQPLTIQKKAYHLKDLAKTFLILFFSLIMGYQGESEVLDDNTKSNVVYSQNAPLHDVGAGVPDPAKYDAEAHSSHLDLYTTIYSSLRGTTLPEYGACL